MRCYGLKALPPLLGGHLNREVSGTWGRGGGVGLVKNLSFRTRPKKRRKGGAQAAPDTGIGQQILDPFERK